MTEELKIEFKRRFHDDPQYFFFCPGRVNLIGEHIDYNGGKVMPCAITLGTWLAVSKNTDKMIRLEAMDFPEKAALHLQNGYSKTGSEWYNYPLGVIDHFVQKEMSVSGMNMLFAGNLPVGSGLSSSASIEVLTAFALNDLFGFRIDNVQLALIGKKVENEFIGVSCGIMDQFAVAKGKKDHAILLNCDTLEHKFIPMKLGAYALAIINTNKPRKLAESKYNERFMECGQALTEVKKKIDVNNLCEIHPEQFNELRSVIGDPVLIRRAEHVIMENARVLNAAIALSENDLEAFGKLMYQSHSSLRDLYEVSGKELDAIVDIASGTKGCIGARMTGAGFGGCAIAIVRKDDFEGFSNKVINGYQKKIGYPPGVFMSEVSDGVCRLD